MPHPEYKQSGDHIRRRQEAMARRRRWADEYEAILEAAAEGDKDRASQLLNEFMGARHIHMRVYMLAEDDDA